MRSCSPTAAVGTVVVVTIVVETVVVETVVVVTVVVVTDVVITDVVIVVVVVTVVLRRSRRNRACLSAMPPSTEKSFVYFFCQTRLMMRPIR